MKLKSRRINKYNVTLMLIFLAISILTFFPVMRLGKIFVYNDGVFHLQRLNEVYLNLKSCSPTFIASHTFGKMGIASFEFYPSVFLYPWALLRFIYKPVTAFYVGYIVIFFVTMVVSYFTMLSYSKGDRVRSIAFALIYGFAGKHITEFMKFQIGEVIAYTFIPIAFLGFYKLMLTSEKKQGGRLLAIGLALIAYSHVLSLYLTVTTMAFIFIVLFLLKKIDIRTFLVCVKSAILFLLLVGWQLMPFIENDFRHKVSTPNFLFHVDPIEFLWHNSWHNIFDDASLGLVISISLVFGWIVINNQIEKWIYVVGVFTTMAATNLFPWEIVKRTGLYNLVTPLQNSFRFLIVSVFFLCITASLLLTRIIRIKKYGIILTVVLFLGFLFSYKESLEGYYSVISNNQATNVVRSQKDKQLPMFMVINNTEYDKMNNYLSPSGSTDYITKLAAKDNNYKNIKNDHLLINGKVKSKVRFSDKNRIVFIFEAKKGDKIDIPVMKYNRTRIEVNGKIVKSQESKRGTVEFMLSSSGRQKVSVYYHPSVLDGLLFIGAIFIWVIILNTSLSQKLNYLVTKSFW
ncbi:hypothetical protein H5993_00505 [Lactobacillus alvi]|uniref:Membrane protein 6-pyruvoyl-tetrahydropterin synthase-related domain-containing protein n=1 Tax=Limosilactobacillus alvi TaxID=990412 RepID=A0ABS2ELD4_9LACO|nr:hypothetical protein [Limosilactobacillus alvi]MBM6753249.1 hypothetical protein [Limosilactobacillus alvi]